MTDESARTGVIAGAAPGDGQSTDQGTGTRFCEACGSPTTAGSGFCGECGHVLREGRGAADAPTVEQAAVPGDPYASRAHLQASAGGAPPPPAPPLGPPPPPYMVPYPHGGAPPPAGASHNTGLIIGLVAAVIAAMAAIGAVILLASGGGGSGPTITTASVAAVTAVPPVSSGSGDASGPGGGSLAVTPKPQPSPSRSGSSPSASSAQTGSAGDAASARVTVGRHWTLIGQGNYEAAFALLDPGYQGQLGHDVWIADKNRDRPTVSSLVVGPAQLTSSSSATVQLVSLHTVGQESPSCHNWTGSYNLTKVNGAWLIDVANLSGTTC